MNSVTPSVLTTNILHRLVLKRIYIILNLQAMCETSRKRIPIGIPLQRQKLFLTYI